MERVNGSGIARETSTEVRDRAIRTQFAMEVARGNTPAVAIRFVSYRSGLRQQQVRRIIETQPPAVRRLTNQETPA